MQAAAIAVDKPVARGAAALSRGPRVGDAVGNWCHVAECQSWFGAESAIPNGLVERRRAIEHIAHIRHAVHRPIPNGLVERRCATGQNAHIRLRSALHVFM
jgi:hypothetical protein